MTEKTSENKGTSRIVVVALGTACIILFAILFGAIANYTSIISGKDSTIATKNSQISSLDSQVSNLQDEVNDLKMLQPFQFTKALEIGAGSLANGMTYFFEVPNGTRLVIEYISARVENLDPSDSIDLQVTTTVNGTRVEHYLGVAGPQGRPKIDPYSHPYQFISQEVRIYADAGSHVSVMGSRTARINNVTIIFSLSGYFVNVTS